MAIREIFLDGDPILTQPCRKVVVFDDRLRELVDDIKQTLDATKHAVGLAAPQVGILKRIAVVNLSGTQHVLINPEIIQQTGRQRQEEGCLSFPYEYGVTIRPKHIVVQAQNSEGSSIEITGKNFDACVLCHEIDHLNGILFQSRFEPKYTSRFNFREVREYGP
ncbi:MAG: peptide deformylase [Candidatus Improbicoccus devescovinae]|nr:MAG: peptide deformylase [Candidatus Improbicoccus devescovinae]